MKTKFRLLPLLAACLAFTACNYDSPLTSKPTRPVDARLLGDWLAVDKDNPKPDLMNVRRFDDSTYVVAMDNALYRAFHSDFAGTAFLTVQDLNSPERLYLYLTFELSADGAELKLRTVSTKVIPEKTKGPAALQELLKQNLRNPALLGDTLTFTRPKPGKL